MTKWLYGDSWERYPIEPGEVWGLPDGSRLAVHNIFDPLPAWMRADLLFVDPPWNQGNLSSFYTKAGRTDYPAFADFTEVLFQRIAEIGAETVYIEIGNQAVDAWYERLAGQFEHVQRWPVTYYRKHPTNIIRGSRRRLIDFDFSGIDEERCISIIAEIEDYQVIADPCMGRGLVGMAAFSSGRRFVGTELNKRRLAVLLDRLDKAGAQVQKIDSERVAWKTPN
jgi:16S rRNA G966 N2-methylase RsmD